MCLFFIKQQPNNYPPDSTFEGAHLPQFSQGIAMQSDFPVFLSAPCANS